MKLRLRRGTRIRDPLGSSDYSLDEQWLHIHLYVLDYKLHICCHDWLQYGDRHKDLTCDLICRLRLDDPAATSRARAVLGRGQAADHSASSRYARSCALTQRFLCKSTDLLTIGHSTSSTFISKLSPPEIWKGSVFTGAIAALVPAESATSLDPDEEVPQGCVAVVVDDSTTAYLLLQGALDPHKELAKLHAQQVCHRRSDCKRSSHSAARHQPDEALIRCPCTGYWTYEQLDPFASALILMLGSWADRLSLA